MDVLVSGASVAGPVLAHWLARAGVRTTVVEQTPQLRLGTGGHAVDLFAPAMTVAERMGIADRLRGAATSSTRLRLERPGRAPIEIGRSALLDDAGTDRHLEIMRGDLTRMLYDLTRDEVDYRFGDSIAGLTEASGGVDVTFERGDSRRFDLVIGADGLHSNVRRLAFGPEEDLRRYLGAYLAVFTVTNDHDLCGQTLLHLDVDRTLAMYAVPGTGQARVVVIFRRREESQLDRRDLAEQKRMLGKELAAADWLVPRLLEQLEEADDFYLDSITQIVMPNWSKGRVSLVGDAAFSPGPAVGGGSSLAIVSAYLLARSIEKNAGDYREAFATYATWVRDYVHACRGVGPRILATGVPGSRAQVRFVTWAMRALPHLPVGVRRRLVAGGATRALSAFELPA